MTTKTVERLLQILRAHGVSHFKTHEVEIMIGHPPALSDHLTTAGPASSSLKSEATPPPTAAAAPPVQMQIPHHINEVKNMLKLDDYSLADKLFPEGAAPEGTE